MSGIQGHMRLVCGCDVRGVSILREQSFRAPVHLSKPHWDEGTLVMNVVNPTAGLLQDDRIKQSVSVLDGARLLLTMPGAARAHRVRNGWAEMNQDFAVEAGGFLEVLPEIFIPQAGACYRQATELHVDAGGELFYFETIAPGRTAAGEVFQYQWLEWATDLWVGGAHVARERLRLEPGTPEVEALRAQFPAAYYGTAFAVSDRFCDHAEVLGRVHTMQSNNVWVGASCLA
ncbi:MAG: urease accessory protein UreD, partial [Verrucomicrobiota bacterium]